MTMHFTHKAGAVLALAALALTAAHPALAQTSYTFTTLDDPLAGAYAINGGTLSGTTAAGINNSGKIVGFYDDSTGTHGFTETPGGGFTTLPDPGVAGSTGALGISNAGVIVGGYYDGTADYGFAYTPGVGFQQISDSSVMSTDGGYTTPYAINNYGQIVGIYAANSNSRIQSFLYTPGAAGTATFQDLSDPNGTSTTARSINDNGQIVGSYSKGGFLAGFLFTPGIGFTDIINPAAPNRTIASGINDSGQVAGYYLSNSGQHGFVETPGIGGALPTFAPLDDPAAVSGLTIRGINNAGQVVGYYRDANGVDHGFLATPAAAVPEASSVVSFGVLLLMGAGGLWSVTRRRAKSAV